MEISYVLLNRKYHLFHKLNSPHIQHIAALATLVYIYSLLSFLKGLCRKNKYITCKMAPVQYYKMEKQKHFVWTE